MKYLRIRCPQWNQVLLSPGFAAGAAGAAAAAGAALAVLLSPALLLLPLLPLSADGAVPVAGALPPRKSVTYQPVPLSWKPAAVTCFLNEDLPQDGQTL